MTNLEVAKCLIVNALAYLKDGNIRTVESNLKKIEILLENPDACNEQYTWDDFK